ncbi:diacylglycerol kinase family protein [Pseudothermotoga thermarum]|uniref:diacylglycerol kinase family protein n=1 Tax=Pseudothermotoga thermarum TaxID=119394 RepID=UPI000305E35D|nr:diacylglycerol kinase family protein [Pseudothermotoga thermarum]
MKSFLHAFEGIEEALRAQRNLKIHFAVAFVVIVVSYFLNISAEEFLWLSFAVFSVIGMELINTLVEALMDVYDKSFDPAIKFVKDVSAGIVLWYSLFATIVGLVVLGKALFHWTFNLARGFTMIYLTVFPMLILIRRLASFVKRKGKNSYRG